MYLLYVDESGDIGHSGSPTCFFALSGFVVHELRWQQVLDSIIAFRRSLKAQYGLKLREEIHTAHFLYRPRDLKRIAKSIRLKILRDVLDFEASLPDIAIINLIVDKRGKSASYDVFEHAWEAMIQRFHNTLSHRNFPGPQNPEDYGLLVADKTDEAKLRRLLRRMRHYNPVPDRGGGGFRMIPLTTFV